MSVCVCVFFVIGINKLVHLSIRAACKKGIGVIGADCRPQSLKVVLYIMIYEAYVCELSLKSMFVN